MSGDEKSGGSRRKRAVQQPVVPSGPLADLKDLVYKLYVTAGTPTLNEIATGIRGDRTLAGAPGRDTVARIIGDAAMPPSQADLVAVVTVLARTARADETHAVGRARDLWTAALTARPVGLPLDEISDPFGLEVHRPVEIDGAAGLPPLPPYIPRGHDAELAEVVRAAAAGASGLAVLVGDSSTGKTRACWEALTSLRRAGGWRLWHPIAPSRPEALQADLARVGPRTVVWLNEAQEYLSGTEGDRVAAGLRELLRDPARAPVMVMATLWRSDWDELTRRPAGGPDAHAQARELLSGRDIPVPSAFTDAELRALRGAGDARLDAAAQAGGGRVTQFLAGAPELLARYRNAPPAARALMDAAIDARRLGTGEAIPLAFLEAAPGYLDDSEWEEAAAADNWLERALAYTAEPCKGTRGPLTRIRPRPGTSTAATGNGAPAYRLADYLDQYGRRARTGLMVPASFWDAAARCADSLSGLRSLAIAAMDRDLLRYAAVFNKQAALLGETGAASSLVMSLHHMHPGDDAPARWAAKHASLDNPLAVAGLTDALRTAGAGAQVAALVARNPAAHVSLGDPFAVGSLLSVLREVGADRQAAILGERAVDHAPLQDPEAVGRLLDALRNVGEDKQTATLLARKPAVHACIDDLPAVGILLDSLREAGARGQAEFLAERAAADAPLEEPYGVAILLGELRTAGAGAQVAVLLARNPAAHASIDDPFAVAGLLDELRRARAGAQVAVLVARNPAAHASFNKPAAVGRLLFALGVAGENGQVAMLMARNPAAHVPLDSPLAVGILLDSLREAGENGQVEILAERAATGAPLENPSAVARLLGTLRRAGADGPAAMLLSRNPAAHVSLDDSDAVQDLLRVLRQAGEDRQAAELVSRLSAAGLFRVLQAADSAARYVFGREPDGSPASTWGWSDIG